MNPDWKLFEVAVANFLSALDPAAKICHNKILPDIDTGLPRQRDVWIETTFGGFVKIKILVSCKRKKAKLNQQDLDAFIGELRSSGAHKGILYSFKGFTKEALKKAEKLEISCCVLYENSKVDIPELISFSAYCFREAFHLGVVGLPIGSKTNWLALLNSPVDAVHGEANCFEELAEQYHKKRDLLAPSFSVENRQLPTWQAKVSFYSKDFPTAIEVTLDGGWKVYRARMDSWLINGSYSFTDQNFVGSMATPSVDTQSYHPGQGWDLVGYNEAADGQNLVVIVLSGADIRQNLRDHLELSLNSPAIAGL